MSGAAVVALVGCGHIGGSLALALRAAGWASRVVGFDADAAVAARARAIGVIDEVAASAAAAAAGADVVVLAVPVRAIAASAAAVAGAGAVVTDVGSVKARVVRACEAVLGGRFVGAHPMAGTEKSGPDAADGALFRGRAVIVTPGAACDAGARALVEAMWRAAGARVVVLSAEEHDRRVAALSHLPHVVAYALAGAMAGAEAELAGLAGGSFESGTRVAASAPAMWAELLGENREALLPWIERFEARLAELKAAIGGGAELERLLGEARAARGKIV